MSEHRIFDLDQHMYETRDTFTRHLPEHYRGQAVTPVTLADGREVMLAGDKIMVALEPEFDEGLQTRVAQGDAQADGPPARRPRPTCSSRCARNTRTGRLAWRRWTASASTPRSCTRADGRCSPRSTSTDTEALYANLTSLNTYMEQEWGFGNLGRIYAPATLSLRNLDLAVAELDSGTCRRCPFHPAPDRAGVRPLAG